MIVKLYIKIYLQEICVCPISGKATLTRDGITVTIPTIKMQSSRPHKRCISFITVAKDQNITVGSVVHMISPGLIALWFTNV